MLELISSQTGEILHYDGENWSVIASIVLFSLSCIVDFDYLSPNDNAKINNIAGSLLRAMAHMHVIVDTCPQAFFRHYT